LCAFAGVAQEPAPRSSFLATAIHHLPQDALAKQAPVVAHSLSPVSTPRSCGNAPRVDKRTQLRRRPTEQHVVQQVHRERRHESVVPGAQIASPADPRKLTCHVKTAGQVDVAPSPLPEKFGRVLLGRPRSNRADQPDDRLPFSVAVVRPGAQRVLVMALPLRTRPSLASRTAPSARRGRRSEPRERRDRRIARPSRRAGREEGAVSSGEDAPSNGPAEG
jgi:hypothetical protein